MGIGTKRAALKTAGELSAGIDDVDLLQRFPFPFISLNPL